MMDFLRSRTANQWIALFFLACWIAGLTAGWWFLRGWWYAVNELVVNLCAAALGIWIGQNKR